MKRQSLTAKSFFRDRKTCWAAGGVEPGFNDYAVNDYASFLIFSVQEDLLGGRGVVPDFNDYASFLISYEVLACLLLHVRSGEGGQLFCMFPKRMDENVPEFRLLNAGLDICSREKTLHLVLEFPLLCCTGF